MANIIALGDEEYALKRADLIDAYGWLEIFNEDLDKKIIGVMNKQPSRSDQLEYDRSDFDKHIVSVGKLLDNCLSYRREYMALQSSAFKQASEYDLFEQQYETLRDLEKASWLEGAREKEKSEHRLVASEFKKLGADLASGFAQAARALENISAAAKSDEAVRVALVDKRWKMLVDHQRMLMTRHTDKGHALNYPDRASRLWSLLEEDIAEAVRKAHVVRDGVRHTLGLTTTSFIKEEKALDEFVRWCRHVLRRIEIETQYDTEYHWTVESRLDDKGNATFKPGDDNAMSLFDDDYFRSMRMRLQAVGASISLTSDAFNSLKDPQLVRGIGELKREESWPMPLDDISVLKSGGPSKYHAGNDLRNLVLAPMEKWTLHIKRIAHPVGDIPPQQIKWVYLHFIGIGKPVFWT